MTNLNIDNTECFLITIDENRKQRSLNELQSLFKNKQINIFDAITHEVPRIGIASSHMKIIEIAKQNNYQNVIIVEDDVKFTSTSLQQYINMCFNNIPDDFDILLSGIYTGNLLDCNNQYWSQIKGDFSALHFYVVNQKAYDIILSFTKNVNIDKWLAHPQGANLNVYVVKQFFAVQYNGYSYNVRSNTNYDHLLNAYKLYK